MWNHLGPNGTFLVPDFHPRWFHFPFPQMGPNGGLMGFNGIYIYIWVNYNELTVLPKPGNHS